MTAGLSDIAQGSAETTTVRDGTPEREAFRFWGLRRSGNHAIISWLMQAGDTADQVFLNNCRMRRPAYDGYSELEWRGEVYRHRHLDQGALPEDELRAIRTARQVFVSYEDVSIDLMLKRRSRGLTPDIDDFVQCDVVILRSLENWLASIWTFLKRKHGATISTIAQILQLVAQWKAADRLSRDNAVDEDPTLHFIRYDRWLTDAEYRDAIIATLGLSRVPPLPDLAPYGGGSSFDGQGFQGRPSDMKLTERWRNVLDDRVMQGIVALILEDRDFVAELEEHHPTTIAVLRDAFAPGADAGRG